MSQPKYLVAVVGAGPAGLYAAKQLTSDSTHVVLFNRDIKPAGLAEYGIYPSKHKMKEGLRKQYRGILASPVVEYYGNVTIGAQGDLSLDDLRALGFHAILVTVGAQGTKSLGLPGENLTGVYHAKDVVYHYNQLPPFSQKEFAFGRKVAIVGVGNVMLDVARYCVRTLKVDEVVAVARRGPAEVKFDKEELEYVAQNLDLAALDAELERARPIMEAVGQDAQAAKEKYFLSALPKAQAKISETRFRFDFLASPTAMVGDAEGRMIGLEVEDNTLIAAEGDTKAKGLGTKRVIGVDTVVFAIGDVVDVTFGLPTKWNAFVKNPAPRFPVDGLSYEAFDPEANKPIADVFVAGWSREASTGLVGAARKDGINGANAILQYLQTLPPVETFNLDLVRQKMASLEKPVITKEDWQKLEKIEQVEAQQRGLEEFKFGTNEEMLKVMGLD